MMQGLGTAMVGLLAALFFLFVFITNAIKILPEYERGVVFRLGRLRPMDYGPGIFLLIPWVDRMVRIPLRTVVHNVPPQDVITKDNVSVKVNAVVYYRVINPRKAVVEVEYYPNATSQLAQTMLRSVLGQHEMDELLSQRERLNATLRTWMPALVRRTRTPSGAHERLEAALFWTGCVYNFCHMHATLAGTPAMAADLTDHRWSIDELIRYRCQRE